MSKNENKWIYLSCFSLTTLGSYIIFDYINKKRLKKYKTLCLKHKDSSSDSEPAYGKIKKLPIKTL